MAIIITVFNQKGGTGKTTVCALLYEAFKKKGIKKACIIDLDPQQSIQTISDALPELGIKTGKASNLNTLNKENDLIIVDTPPSLDPSVNASIKGVLPYTDLILLPVKPSVTDTFSLQPTIQLIKSIQKEHSVKAAILINSIRTGSEYNKAIKTKIESYGLPVLTTQLGNRVAYSRCFLSGGIYKEGNKKAITEIEHLSNEIYTLISI